VASGLARETGRLPVLIRAALGSAPRGRRMFQLPPYDHFDSYRDCLRVPLPANKVSFSEPDMNAARLERRNEEQPWERQ